MRPSEGGDGLAKGQASASPSCLRPLYFLSGFASIIPGRHKDAGPGSQKPESLHATLTVFTESEMVIYRKGNIELIDF